MRIIYIISVVAALWRPYSALAQSRGIQFKNFHWEQALDSAKKENKFLFVDVSSSLNSNTIQGELEKGIFQVDSIADFFNSNFISIKVDLADKKVNKSFGPKLQSLMYPVYLFLAENGDQIGYISPYTIKKGSLQLIISAAEAINKGLIKRKNTKRIAFEKLTWNEAKTKAKKENKLIFFDAYTNWCRPCIQMDKDIFTLDEVADFFNENFINIKTNSEQSEGIAIRKKYSIDAFPTFLFTDAEGNLVLRARGYKDRNKFLAIARDALSKYTDKSIGFIVQDMEQAKQQAEKTDKPILFDAYTTWCAPCKQMEKEVFTQYDVAKYYNDEYINVKYDMEKGEGVGLKLQYQINAFPTYLVLDKDGNVMHRTVGAMPAADFIEFGKAGKSELTLSAMEANYATGKRDEAFVLQYIKVLSQAGLHKKMHNAADAYFAGLEASKKLADSTTWQLIKNYILYPDSKAIAYVVKNKAKFIDLFGDKIDDKLYRVYLRGVEQFAQFNEQKELIAFDEKGFIKYLRRVKKIALKKYDKLAAYAWMMSYRMKKDWQNYVAKVDTYINAEVIDKGAFSVYNYALVVEKNCKDADMRKKAWDWLVDAEKSAPEYYEKPIDQLKEKLLDMTAGN